MLSKRGCAFLWILTMGASHLAVSQALLPPVVPPRTTAIEAKFGTTVVDDYRDFEQLDSRTVDWIKAEGRYARLVLDSIPGRAMLQRRLELLHGKIAAVRSFQVVGDRLFCLFRPPGADDFDLVVRSRHGQLRKITDIHALRVAHENTAFAISYFLASPDGLKVAVGISANGSEDAILSVYDLSGHQLAGPIDRDEFGFNAWSPDGSTLFMNRLRKLDHGASADAKTRDTTIDEWNLKDPPKTVFSRQLFPSIADTDTPRFIIPASSGFAYLTLTDGANPNIAIYVAPVEGVSVSASWRRIVAHEDGVTAFSAQGSMIYLLSSKEAPTFKVLALDPSASFANSRIVLDASSDRVIDNIHAAADGLYVVARRGLYSELLRISAGADLQQLTLPQPGQIVEASSSPDQDGLVFDMADWTLPLQSYAYRPAEKTVEPLQLSPTKSTMAIASAVETNARAPDGVQIPLTIVSRPRDSRPRPLILQVYGSYGISMLPWFDPSMIQFLNEGGSFAICHVRGGGERGDAWRLAGKDANKHNTWEDLIACAEELIGRRLTTARKLIIYGGSAGGLAVGRAATEHADLFAGVIANVPFVNSLRLQHMPEGALETPEFGSDETEAGFRNLLAMDVYHHVRSNTRYPPFLIGMGLNDPRIAAWQPAKLAARLQSLNNPVLLRVDPDNGHGVGSTRLQFDAMAADFLAFAFWRSGEKQWQPKITGVR